MPANRAPTNRAPTNRAPANKAPTKQSACEPSVAYAGTALDRLPQVHGGVGPGRGLAFLTDDGQEAALLAGALGRPRAADATPPGAGLGAGEQVLEVEPQGLLVELADVPERVPVGHPQAHPDGGL